MTILLFYFQLGSKHIRQAQYENALSPINIDQIVLNAIWVIMQVQITIWFKIPGASVVVISTTVVITVVVVVASVVVVVVVVAAVVVVVVAGVFESLQT